MQYKSFPSEKRTYILQKPLAEFEQFFQELSPTEQNHFVSRLPELQRGGFLPHSPRRRKMQLIQLLRDAKNPENSHYTLAWNILEGVWQAWIVSHHELHMLLEQYDNSDDFQDDEPKPPNTYLDIECLKYLTYASFNNKINKELIKKFYEFGYFKKDNVIDSHIKIANSLNDIENNRAIFSALGIIEKIKIDTESLEKKSSEIVATYETTKNEVEKFYSVIHQQRNELIERIEDLSSRLLLVDDIKKRLALIENFTKIIEEVCKTHQKNGHLSRKGKSS